MKKIMFVAIAMIAMTVISCKNGEAKDAAVESDSTVVEVVDTLTPDTIVVDSVVAE